MAAKKLMNVHEALEYLGNLDVSSEDDLLTMRILFQEEDWLFYLQTARMIETPMKIQEIKMSFSQTIWIEVNF